jgi:PAS domain S-box-containing protein/putative nucleotidyltransferase with HDIG domain
MKAKAVILIVDDHLMNIELLEAYLSPEGYEIVRATSGEEALEKLSGNQIDLILLDVIMTGIDGYEVTRRIRQNGKQRLLPIILVTALQETEDRVKGIEAGCDDFLSKPVDRIELLVRVRSLLKVKAYNDLMINYRNELEATVNNRTEELRKALENLQQDITERKQAEESLRVSEEKYRIVVENAKEAIIVTQDMKVVFVNRAGIDMIGYSDKKLTPQPIINFIHPDDIDMVADHHIRRLNGEDVQNVYSFRLVSQDGTVKWVEINAAVINWKEKPATLNFLNDITERKQAEEELHQTLEKLRKAFASTVNVMVSAVEMRDPYTAGHQLRVANLACAIAAEMGLSNDKIEGLRMAGFIHDIGKLSIPAEILSKPTKLTNTEFSLIKEHPQVGYDMLKNVESPWPLAQIVYQHHERMDGSGYPGNLKGDEIIMEARIMAVADVVEAMASHRPYRAALGIDAALEEIEKNRGTLYDNAVADTCLKLFREKGYKLIA